MKEYTITIKIEEVKRTSLLDTIFAEVEQEKVELSIAHKLNEEASEIRRNYFSNLLTEVNEALKPLSIERFTGYKAIEESNRMLSFESNGVYIGSMYYRLILNPILDYKKDPPTKYLTSTEDFDIILATSGGSKFKLDKTNVIESLISFAKRGIKQVIHNNKR